MYRKRYRLKKRIKNFLIFYCCIAFLFIANYTFARYITTTSSTSQIGVANFQVKVNDVDVVLGETFEFELSPNANTYNSKMAPNSKGYFEIEIDPSETEVALDYEFQFDLSKIDEDVHLTEFHVNDSTKIAIEDNVVQGTIDLPNQDTGFTTDDKTNLKIYWEWNEEGDIINPVITDTNIEVTSVIKQKIA